MSPNFKLPLKTADLPTISSNKISYRVITASLLVLAAIMMLLASCSKETSEPVNPSTGLSSESASSTTSTVNPIRIFPETSSAPKLKSQMYNPTVANSRIYSTTENTLSSESAYYYTMDSVDYYMKNHYFADERIQMDNKVAYFIKHPPLKSNPGYYKRYHKVKADFFKARRYRKKLEKLENKHLGRNSRNQVLTNDLEAKRKNYFEIEARLFYQLEKIVYYAEQSYYQWQIFKSYDPVQLTKFERYSIHRSEHTANMFQDLSYAVNNYTNSAR